VVLFGAAKSLTTLNEAFSTLSVRRRYEVWFLRIGLADGSGAWWFRYLLFNPGRGGCVGNPRGMPVQVWATWFPAGSTPQSFVQGFPLEGVDLSCKGQSPFHFRIGGNDIDEDSCRGALEVDGHTISWNLSYRSSFRLTLSHKGWIGFSRTPHSDAIFSGQITFDGREFTGDPLGFGVQGHNCGYRHRNFWTWAHAYFPQGSRPATTLEALVYEMPLGLVFRKAVLWHDGKQHVFRRLDESGSNREDMQWKFRSVARDGTRLEAAIDGRGSSQHRLPYIRTDCSGSFEVTNNSLASASMLLEGLEGASERLETNSGAVLEMVG
jgi:hypothetical protein